MLICKSVGDFHLGIGDESARRVGNGASDFHVPTWPLGICEGGTSYNQEEAERDTQFLEQDLAEMHSMILAKIRENSQTWHNS